MPEQIMKFFSWVRKTLGGAVTEHDNTTHDIVKHGSWIGLAYLLYHANYQLHHEVVVNVKDIAIAITTILSGTGLGVMLKRNSEHEDEGGGHDDHQ
jgi:hypothetical protein